MQGAATASSVEASAPIGTGPTEGDADGLADLDELDDLDIPLGEAKLDDLADLEDLEDLEALNAAPTSAAAAAAAAAAAIEKSPAPVANLTLPTPTSDAKP